METEAVLEQRKQEELEKKSVERDAFIARIKAEISQPYDNINSPIPLATQLQSGQ